MMKIYSLLILILISFVLSCTNQEQNVKVNPFFGDYNTPFNVPPFDEIDTSHYMPAFIEGMEQEKAEIDEIINNQDEPNFENTILAYDNSGEVLRKVRSVFFRLNGANTNETMQQIAREVTPLLSAHRNEISLNQGLFQKIKAVYEKRNEFGLDENQLMVVEKIYKDFERSGANLPQDKKEELKSLNSELAMLSLKFGENLLAETNGFKLIIDKEEDLAGLPEGVVEAAKIKAENLDMSGKWVFTLQKPSMIPFLQYAENRSLRERIYKAYYNRGNNNNANDNKNIVEKIVKLRDQRSKLLGFENYADYRLEINMAKEPENVLDFLMKVWEPALKVAKNELKEMQAIADKEGKGAKLQSWDWWYYAEKLRKEKFDLDEEELKPYFSLSNVRDGIFALSNKLYGLEFIERTDVPKYHNEVEVFEVREADGTKLGILYIDSHPRDGKRVGAWCGAFSSHEFVDGERVPPVVSIVTNFTRPTSTKPSLLSWDETTTYFHEFGHALHNLFANEPYRRLVRDVPRDLVELPSQIMENWAGETELLKMYAKHYETGEVIPDELIEKIQKSGHFNQGFATVEYVAASLLDIQWHTTPNFENIKVESFEKNAMNEIGLIDEIIPRYRTTYFNHIFNSGYASGYYVYLWAEVLDSDAFIAFKESGDLFNQELAAKFRKYALAESGLREGMVAYKAFRGKEPSIDGLLNKRGLK